MPTALALIDDRIAVASLRKPSHGLYASTVPSDRTSPKQLLKLVALVGNTRPHTDHPLRYRCADVWLDAACMPVVHHVCAS